MRGFAVSPSVKPSLILLMFFYIIYIQMLDIHDLLQIGRSRHSCEAIRAHRLYPVPAQAAASRHTL
jgi:hypothetical protein